MTTETNTTADTLVTYRVTNSAGQYLELGFSKEHGGSYSWDETKAAEFLRRDTAWEVARAIEHADNLKWSAMMQKNPFTVLLIAEKRWPGNEHDQRMAAFEAGSRARRSAIDAAYLTAESFPAWIGG